MFDESIHVPAQKRVLITQANTEGSGSGEPVHPRSLVRAFAVRTHNIWNLRRPSSKDLKI